MDTDGSNRSKVTQNSTQDEHPRFTPHGSKIVFVSYDLGVNRDIYIMDIDSTDQTNLTNTPSWDWKPQMSTDGSKIVFESFREGNWDVFLYDFDKSYSVNLTRDSDSADSSPQFLP